VCSDSKLKLLLSPKIGLLTTEQGYAQHVRYLSGTTGLVAAALQAVTVEDSVQGLPPPAHRTVKQHVKTLNDISFVINSLASHIWLDTKTPKMTANSQKKWLSCQTTLASLKHQSSSKA